MRYQTTIIEDWVKNFYYSIDIYQPRQLDLEEIAARLGIIVHYKNFSSRVYDGEIILDKRLSLQQQWEDFGHELCHVLRHYGNQTYMTISFLDHQEAQANNFALHFCVPTFMLLRNEIINYLNIEDGITFVAETFNVTESFAKKRLLHFRNQLQQAESDKKFRLYMNRLYPKASPENWSEETKSLLDKLNTQIEKKKTLQGV
ncbi:hypothetical protein CHH83_19610 [Bacillus sp. 7586-K]|nr:hypothetical protein CHH83_19610 [Bacillus sp. 7586-K]